MKYIKGDYFIVPNRDFLRGKPANYRSVYVALCVYANEDGECFPSIKTICETASVSKNNLKSIIDQMVADGVLAKTNRMDGKENKSNLYQIMLMGGGSNGVQGGGSNEGQGWVKSGNVTISTELEPISKDIGQVVSKSKKAGKIPTPISPAESQDLISRLHTNFGRADYEELISEYMKRRKMVFKTREAFYETVNRHRKIAKKLVESFMVKDIVKGIEQAQKRFADEWTLETVLKMLTK